MDNQEDAWRLIESLSLPKEILLLGSGVTKPLDSWPPVASLRVNIRTLCPMVYHDKWPIHTIIVNNRIKRQLGSCWHTSITTLKPRVVAFDTTKEMASSRVVSDRFVSIGASDLSGSAYDTLRLSGQAYGLDLSPSTGFHVLLWLLYADVDTIYIAGFDGRSKGETYHAIAGRRYTERETHDYHSFAIEWSVIERLGIPAARARGVNVHVAKDGLADSD